MNPGGGNGRGGLSADEAEAALVRHFRRKNVSAHVFCGCYVVNCGEATADSSASFEDAIRVLAKLRPELVRVPLDDPRGYLKVLAAERDAGAELRG